VPFEGGRRDGEEKKEEGRKVVVLQGGGATNSKHDDINKSRDLRGRYRRRIKGADLSCRRIRKSNRWKRGVDVVKENKNKNVRNQRGVLFISV